MTQTDTDETIILWNNFKGKVKWEKKYPRSFFKKSPRKKRKCWSQKIYEEPWSFLFGQQPQELLTFLNEPKNDEVTYLGIMSGKWEKKDEERVMWPKECLLVWKKSLFFSFLNPFINLYLKHHYNAYSVLWFCFLKRGICWPIWKGALSKKGHMHT